jgi:hypothetical protein
MASQTTRNRRGKGKRKKYENAVPGSRAPRPQRDPFAPRPRLVQVWVTHLGAFRTRKEAVRNNLTDDLPVLRRLRG